MPLKVNVGLSKKIGLPHYSSLGASCHVEVELDSTLLFADLDGFHDKVRRAYGACHQAVGDELLRQQAAETMGSSRVLVTHEDPVAADNVQAALVNRVGLSEPRTNGAPQCSAAGNHAPSRASSKQLSYARQLAGKISSLEQKGLEKLTDTLFGKQLGDLSSFEASSLIDTLKQVAAGSIDLVSLQAGGTQ